jgi:hypothetical protein
MKLKYIYHYIGLMLLILLIYSNVSYLYRYLSHSLIETVYSYSRYIGFILLPLGLVTGILFVYLCFRTVKSGIDKVYIFVWIVMVFLTIIQYCYFQFESQKLRIVIKNFSSRPLHNLEITGRSAQEFRSNVLREGDSINFICKCRDITHQDSIGVNISFKFSESQSRRFEVVSLNKPEYRDPLQVLIINDTLTVVNHDIKDQWIRLERPSRKSLYESKEVEELIRK